MKLSIVPILCALMSLGACDEPEVAPPESTESPESPEMEVPPGSWVPPENPSTEPPEQVPLGEQVDGEMSFVLDGENVSLPDLRVTENTYRDDYLCVTARSEGGVAPILSVTIAGFDFASATFPATIQGRPPEPEQPSGVVVIEAPATNGVFIRFDPDEHTAHTGTGDVTVESFDEGVVVGRVDEVRPDGTALPSLRSIRFRAQLTRNGGSQ